LFPPLRVSPSSWLDLLCEVVVCPLGAQGFFFLCLYDLVTPFSFYYLNFLRFLGYDQVPFQLGPRVCFFFFSFLSALTVGPFAFRLACKVWFCDCFLIPYVQSLHFSFLFAVLVPPFFFFPPTVFPSSGC